MESSGNLEALVQRVLEKARTQSDSMVERARKASDREVGRAEAQYREQRESFQSQLRDEAESRLRSLRSESERKIRRASMIAIQEAVDSVFSDALEAAGKEFDSKERLELLKELLIEGAQAVDSVPARVRLNERELDLLRRECSSELREDGEYHLDNGLRFVLDEDPINTAGGPLVTDMSGRVVYDNTFEARLERKREDLRRMVSKALSLEAGKKGPGDDH